MLMAMKAIFPTFDVEQRLWQAGFCYVAGLDEAGRGALAGPVVAAAVIVAQDTPYIGVWKRVRDSKKLSARQRSELAAEIQQEALAWAVGMAAPATIDRVNIAVATRQAMRQAIANLDPAPDHLLLDWIRLPQVNLQQESMVRADQHIATVAAASILAKVHRDALLLELDEQYPAYGFAAHKGYGTAAHRAAIARHGPCPAHRYTFRPIASHRPTLLATGAATGVGAQQHKPGKR